MRSDKNPQDALDEEFLTHADADWMLRKGALGAAPQVLAWLASVAGGLAAGLSVHTVPA
jgi:hypothetical protein